MLSPVDVRVHSNRDRHKALCCISYDLWAMRVH